MKKLYTIVIITILATNSLFAQDFEVGGIAYNIISSIAPYTVEVTSKYPAYTGDIIILFIVFNEV